MIARAEAIEMRGISFSVAMGMMAMLLPLRVPQTSTSTSSSVISLLATLAAVSGLLSVS